MYGFRLPSRLSTGLVRRWADRIDAATAAGGNDKIGIPRSDCGAASRPDLGAGLAVGRSFCSFLALQEKGEASSASSRH